MGAKHDIDIKENKYDTVKPLITNTSEEFIICRLDNFSMSFILSIYEYVCLFVCIQ